MTREVPLPQASPPVLPRPFYDGWPGASQDAVRALWHWHLSLWDPGAPGLEGEDLTRFFEAEYARAEAGKAVGVVPEAVWRAAYEACERHRLPRALLAGQVAAARLFREPIRFLTFAELNGFIQQWAGSHARLLARLADAGYSWQIPYVDELAKAFFIVGRLVVLPHDLARDRLFIPESELEQAGVTLVQLQAGPVDEPMRRLLWKQAVRARDAFAQGLSLASEVAPRTARALLRWGLGGLELLNELERRDYDLWSRTLGLSTRHRLQVRLQARFGRTTFGKR